MRSSQNFRNPLYERHQSFRNPSSSSILKEDAMEEWPSSIGEESTSNNQTTDFQHLQSYRTVRVHVSEIARHQALQFREFCGNELVTSKYSPLTFLPVNLFHQFSRAVNLYFLVNAMLELIPGLSPTNWSTTIVPLSFVLLLNAVKEAHEDHKRHKSDREVNRRPSEVLLGEGLAAIKWKQVIVGDVVRVQNNSEIPADLVFLSSSDPQGVAYLETANLDGDTNLKIRNAFYQSSTLNHEDGDMSFQVLSGLIIECEQPNNRLYEFQGSVSFQGQGLMPLDVSQFLLRGATLRNTQWVMGAVVFTGADTKYMTNMVYAPRKVSHLERKTNILVSGLFILQLLLCMGLAIGHFMWSNSYPSYYYLATDNAWPELGLQLGGLLVQFVRFVILLSSLIPMSLYVTLEAVKLMQCFFIQWDIHMIHAATGIPAQARTSNLNEELGQVQYVLSDKTGTLTQNVMSFVQCSINGVVYGNIPGSGSSGKEKSGCGLHSVCEDEYLVEELRWTGDPSSLQSQKCRDFFLHLAMCHTVIPTYLDDDESEIRYQASSPDEEALVQGAALCGFKLVRRVAEELVVECQGQFTETQTILAVLEFTSDRKRMSIICRNSEGRIKLYCKGADSVILKRLTKDQGGISEVSVKHLEEFAHAGYRTLCIAEREIEDSEFEKWASRFRAASFALDDREEKVAEAADFIERELVLLGVTAVEDKLQDGVRETVTILAQAGIKLWVLTGDRLETAVSIGLSCNLLADSMHLFLLCESSFNVVPQLLQSMLDEARQRMKMRRNSDMAVLIEGNTLSIALEENNRTSFMQLCQECRTVVFCRISPLQKALITQLVKENNLAVTLAIGDGANDVAMIKAAHIGVGISGREGMAAVLASDFSIGQFCFLSRLLLIHGRWSYKRNKVLVLYALYKNLVCVMGQCYLAFFSGLSAQSLYPSSLISTYNLLWTSLPTTAFSILDKDVNQMTVENNPQLYIETQSDKIQVFFKDAGGWFLSGFWHSLVALFFSLASITSAGSNGRTIGIYTVGLTVYTLVIVIVYVKIVMIMNSFTIISSSLVWIVSILLYFSCLLGLSYSEIATGRFNDLNDAAYRMCTNAAFWLVLCLGVVSAFVPDCALSAFRRQHAPKDCEIFQEIEHGWKNGVRSEDMGYAGPVKRRMSVELRLQQTWISQSSPPMLDVIPMARAHPTHMHTSHGQHGCVENEDNLPARRRMTWREVLSEVDFEMLSRVEFGNEWTRRISNGFEVVTRHTDATSVPRPLDEGPLPLFHGSSAET